MDRVKALVPFGKGWNVANVAEARLNNEKTVRRWLETFRLGGEEELLSLRYQGKSPLLNKIQQSELARGSLVKNLSNVQK